MGDMVLSLKARMTRKSLAELVITNEKTLF
jgi:hypothetical protein